MKSTKSTKPKQEEEDYNTILNRLITGNGFPKKVNFYLNYSYNEFQNK